MSRSDFMLMSIDELAEVFRSWRETREEDARTVWESARLQACITIQPFVKGRLDPKRILPLPWDRGFRPPKMSAEERKRQQERLNHYLKHGEWPD